MYYYLNIFYLVIYLSKMYSFACDSMPIKCARNYYGGCTAHAVLNDGVLRIIRYRSNYDNG